MSNIDKQALNPAELESALRELKRISEQPAVTTHYARVLRKYIANLEGDLKAAGKRIAELERKEQHSERQSVIDALAASGEAWSDIEEYMQEWDAARAAAAGKGE